MTDALTPEQIAAITAEVDITAPPPDDAPTALFVFGTNQAAPAEIAAERYHRGLAPLIIVTGGVNRHDGSIEGQVFHRKLTDAGVPDEAILMEDSSANTWQNVEFSVSHVHRTRAAGLRITAVSKWYHRRALHALATVTGVGSLYAIGYAPNYSGQPITTTGWADHPDGPRKVLRERDEVARRITAGDLAPLALTSGMWRMLIRPQARRG